MAYFMIALIPYINLFFFSNNKKSTFEEYGAFNIIIKICFTLLFVYEERIKKKTLKAS